MKIYIGSDHAGYELKEKLKVYLMSIRHEVEDKGAFSLDPSDDYPDFIIPVAEAVAKDWEAISSDGDLEALLPSLGIILG